MSVRTRHVVMYGIRLPYSVYKDLPEAFGDDDTFGVDDFLDNEVDDRESDIGYIVDGRCGDHVIVGKELASTGDHDQTRDFIALQQIDRDRRPDVEDDVFDFIEETVGIDYVEERIDGRLYQKDFKILVLTDDA